VARAKLSTSGPRAELQHEMAANVETLVARLRGPARDQARTAALLAQQVWADASLRAPYAAAGALPLLVALLRSADTAAQASAADALDELARDEDLRQHIVDTGAVPALVALLRSGTERGKTIAACALARLEQDVPARTLIVNASTLIADEINMALKRARDLRRVRSHGSARGQEVKIFAHVSPPARS
jgi:hypothetical protein